MFFHFGTYYFAKDRSTKRSDRQDCFHDSCSKVCPQGKTKFRPADPFSAVKGNMEFLGTRTRRKVIHCNNNNNKRRGLSSLEMEYKATKIKSLIKLL